MSEYNREQAALTSSNYHINSTVVNVPLGSPDIVNHIKSLERDGFKYFIGPLASSSVTEAIKYTDTTDDIVLLSPSSTAASLAIEDDSLFRLVPSDDEQVPIIMNRIQSQGRDHVVLIYRDDTWGVGLRDTITSDYAGMIAADIGFSLDDSDPPQVLPAVASEVTTRAATHVDRLVSSHGVDNVAVLLLSFDVDTVALIQHIVSDTALAATLGDVRWYGADGTAEQSEVVDDPDVAAFLLSVDFAASKFEAAPNPINLRIDAQAFGDDATYGDNVYDAVFLLADTVIINDEDLDRNPNTTVRSLILDVADGLRDHDHRHSARIIGAGALGEFTLNEAGDMSSPLTYEFYGIYQTPSGAYAWDVVPDPKICR